MWSREAALAGLGEEWLATTPSLGQYQAETTRRYKAGAAASRGAIP